MNVKWKSGSILGVVFQRHLLRILFPLACSKFWEHDSAHVDRTLPQPLTYSNKAEVSHLCSLIYDNSKSKKSEIPPSMISNSFHDGDFLQQDLVNSVFSEAS